MKKLIGVFLSVFVVASLVACEKSTQGSVYFFNFKPEQGEAYNKIARRYTRETGVKVKVFTAAAGSYDAQLKSELAKKNAPTIFQINGPVGYRAWKNYCADITESEICKHLVNAKSAIKSGGKVYGVPIAIEGYGIIYNKAITDKYCALPTAKVSAMTDITSFQKLKEVVEDMTANKSKIDISGVFASTSLYAGEDWRWHTHLANVAIASEFATDKIDLDKEDSVDEIGFIYADNFKNLFDLYIDNSIASKSILGVKTVNDSMSEFALGEVAMVQNGNWAYSQIAGQQSEVVKPEDIKFLPMYMGLEGEENQGICIGTENFLCINNNSSMENQKASLAFLEWLYTSEEGKKHVIDDLGFIAPFDTFGENDQPNDPLGAEVVKWYNDQTKNNIKWDFTVFPSKEFKDKFASDLLQYVREQLTWQQVVSNVISNWKKERAHVLK